MVVVVVECKTAFLVNVTYALRLSRGHADPFCDTVRKAHTVRMMQGDKLLTSFNFISAPGEAYMSRFSTMSILQQSRIEHILEAELEKQLNGKNPVERSSELDSYTDGTDGVKATIIKRDREGKEVDREVIECKYIVGCDGVHSKVRHGVPGWSFEGM